jgi:hypothetical protein
MPGRTSGILEHAGRHNALIEGASMPGRDRHGRQPVLGPLLAGDRREHDEQIGRAAELSFTGGAMFLQVIDGQVSDRAGLRERLDRWTAELSSGAEGWLGTTWGFYDGDKVIALVRFESADAAKRNSDRPEQGEWWSGVSSTFAGEPSFADFDDVIVLGPGGSDEAGFVQVMRGRVIDPERERRMTKEFSTMPPGFRPDIIGGVAAIADDGSFTQVMYFTSEEAAREGEKQPMPPEMQTMMEESQSNTAEITFIDLTSPVFNSPS